MKRKFTKAQNQFVRTLSSAALMVCSITTVFYGFTQVAVAAENNKVTAVPTVYPASISTLVTAAQEKTPEGYTKPSYTVVDNSLEYYRSNKPTVNDISRNDAAELGVQTLWAVYGLDLNGKTIEMGYIPAADISRAKWVGDYWVEGQKGPDHEIYTFTIDAITGGVYDVRYGRILDHKVNVGYDAKLASNPTAMENAAKKYAEDLNVTGSKVKSSTIVSQGCAVNDPVANFRIVGENGQLAIIGMSRYDNALLTVNYNGSVVEMDAAIGRIENIASAMDDKRE